MELSEHEQDYVLLLVVVMGGPGDITTTGTTTGVGVGSVELSLPMSPIDGPLPPVESSVSSMAYSRFLRDT